MAHYTELPKLNHFNLQFELTTVINDDGTNGTNSNNNNGTDAPHCTQLISHTLHACLCEMKEQIKECGEDAWDAVKKYTNPFEFIHTAIPNSKFYTVSKMRPLSRSFYKMIEMHATFFDPLHDPAEMTSFHLAEGPGGFIEAMIHIRSKHATTHRTNDVHYGMTLLQADACCPGWKKSRGFLELHRDRVCIETGADGTGNIISAANFQHCAAKYQNTCNLITADGGFDFSCDFNNQETMVLRLLIAELGFALALQKQGGHFILKLFDTFTKPTIDVIYVLCNFYKTVFVSKPCTSRHANSERYLVCKHFKPASTQDLMPQLHALFGELEHLPANATITSLLPFEHDLHYLNRLEECNAIIGQQQMETINSTINLILNKCHAEKLEMMKRFNLVKCMSWCDKHGIPYNNTNQSSNIFLNN
jgi:23S rRNA U2552 (ribose-2'-O)-methylase RlmE/FtsJ